MIVDSLLNTVGLVRKSVHDREVQYLNGVNRRLSIRINKLALMEVEAKYCKARLKEARVKLKKAGIWIPQYD